MRMRENTVMIRKYMKNDGEEALFQNNTQNCNVNCFYHQHIRKTITACAYVWVHVHVNANVLYQTWEQTAFIPVSVSKLTVAWNLFPCLRISRVSATSRLSLFSWIRCRALSRLSQKLISCNAVPDEGSRSSFVTCAMKIKTGHLSVIYFFKKCNN